MPVKQWNVGDVLTSADMNTWTVPLAASKTVDTARSSNITLSADPELQLSAAAGSIYAVEAVVRYKGGTNGSSDAQFTIFAPTGATGFFIANRINISSPNAIGFIDAAFGVAVNAATLGTTNTMQIFIKASVTTSGTAGTISVGWAQNTSSVTATTVMTGSYLWAQKIG